MAAWPPKGSRQTHCRGAKEHGRQEHQPNRHPRDILAAAALAGLGALAAAPAHADHFSDKSDGFLKNTVKAAKVPATTLVIARLSGPLTAAQQAQLTALGATTTATLSTLNAIGITLPTASLSALANLSFITHMSQDVVMTKQDAFTVGSSGAAAAFQQYGLTGRGVTVAVIDSGVHDQADFGGTSGSRITQSQNFVPSGTWTTDDLCGHGTHVAGIIAGNGAASTGPANARTKALPPRPPC